MKQYKLIKEYPGSPTLGSIWKEYPNHKSDYPLYSEYWEEVKQKEWEILSYKCKYTKDLWIEDINLGEEYWSRRGNQTSPHTTKQILIHKNYSIHSVKRLSDGEVFTIGDKFTIPSNPQFGIGTIDILNIWKDSKDDKGYMGVPDVCITNMKKYIPKQPLFITEDAVEIFRNTNFWFVITNDNSESNWRIKDANSNGKYYFNYVIHKLFSTKEKAQEYIDKNKPKYSLKDIENSYYLTKWDGFKSMEEELKKLNK